MTNPNDSSNSWLQRQQALLNIVGARLTSVQFVLNYLILGFDEKGAITSLVWPEVICNEKKYRYGSFQYRDCLCELITQVVQTASIDSEDTINIGFTNGTALSIPLKSYSGRGERAIFTAPNHFLRTF